MASKDVQGSEENQAGKSRRESETVGKVSV